MHWIATLENAPKKVNHASVALGDHVYLFGGYSSDEGVTENQTMDVHVLNTRTNRWYKHPVSNLDCSDGVTPCRRYGHTVVEYEGDIFVFGGRFDKNASSEVHRFNVSTQSWTQCETFGEKPLGRDGHSVCLQKNLMYVFFGFEDDSEAFAKSIYSLNLNTLHWTRVHTTGAPPPLRDFHTSTLINEKVYVFGGRGTEMANGTYTVSTETCFADLWCLDLRTNDWKEIIVKEDKPPARRSHSAFVYKDKMYIFGGYNTFLDEYFNDFYEFCPRKNQWREVKALGIAPTKRRRHTSLVVDKKLFVIGGASTSTSEKPDKVSNNGATELGDLNILHFDVTLRDLALLAIKKWNLDTSQLPNSLQWDYCSLTGNSKISI